MVDRPDRRHGEPGPRPAAVGDQHRPDRRGRAGPGRDRRPAAGGAVLGRQGGGAWLDGHRLAVRDADAFHNQDNVCVGTNALRAVDPRTLPGRLRDLGSACCEQTFVAANRLQACTFLGEATHDIAADVVIAVEAGCQFGTIAGERLSPAEMVRRTPVTCPTFVAAPRRLEALMAMARRLDGGQP